MRVFLDLFRCSLDCPCHLDFFVWVRLAFPNQSTVCSHGFFQWSIFRCFLWIPFQDTFFGSRFKEKKRRKPTPLTTEKKRDVFDTLDFEWILITKKYAKPWKSQTMSLKLPVWGEVALVASCFSSLFFSSIFPMKGRDQEICQRKLIQYNSITLL